MSHDIMMPPSMDLPSLLKTSNLQGLDSVIGGKKSAAVEAAKGFESVLLGKLMESMKATIEESGLFDDGASGQVNDIFYMFLAEDLAKRGGIGLWKLIQDHYGSAMEAPSQADAPSVEVLK